MTTDKQRKNYGILLLDNEMKGIQNVLKEFECDGRACIKINGVFLSDYGVCQATVHNVCSAIRCELEQSLEYLQKEKKRLNEQSKNAQNDENTGGTYSRENILE